MFNSSSDIHSDNMESSRGCVTFTRFTIQPPPLSTPKHVGFAEGGGGAQAYLLNRKAPTIVTQGDSVGWRRRWRTGGKLGVALNKKKKKKITPSPRVTASINTTNHRNPRVRVKGLKKSLDNAPMSPRLFNFYIYF